MCRWSTTEWAVRLVPLLTGKARSGYIQLDIAESLNYEKVKAAILIEYDINPESNHLKFSSSEMGRDGTPKDLYIRLKELYLKRIQPHNQTTEEIEEVLTIFELSFPDRLKYGSKNVNPNLHLKLQRWQTCSCQYRGNNLVWTYTYSRQGANKLD